MTAKHKEQARSLTGDMHAAYKLPKSSPSIHHRGGSAEQVVIHTGRGA